MPTYNGNRIVSADTTTTTEGLSLGMDGNVAKIRSMSSIDNANRSMMLEATYIDLSFGLFKNTLARQVCLTTYGQVTVPSGPAVVVPLQVLMDTPPFSSYEGGEYVNGSYDMVASPFGNQTANGYRLVEFGLYLVMANVRFLLNGQTGGMRQVWFSLNGNTPFGVNRMAQGGYNGHLVISTQATVMVESGSAGHTVELLVGQDSGADLNLDKQNYCPTMTIVKLS